jgi:two-component system OmpR family sensor kinase
MIESLRARLTLWYVSVLGAVLVGVCILIYVLLGRALHTGVDADLRAVTGIAITSLSNDLAEGQSVRDAAQSTAAELISDLAVLAIYDGQGRPLAEARRDDDLRVALPPLDDIPRDEPLLFTVEETRDTDDRHRMAVRRATIAPSGTEYVILASADLEPISDELESLREILWYVVPGALVIAGFVGWFLARHSLSPVMLMAERARRIGVENLGGRLPVANPRDELGRLAETFNELLGRLAGSFAQQRQFMADASHELRTPVATARTAAAVALQGEHRSEDYYRETLQIIEQQTSRLARVVDDMFTLARADAGNFPVQHAPLYLDELVGDTVRAARVLAASKQVTIACKVPEQAPITGDEDLLKRMVANLLDNAVKHAPAGSEVRIELAAQADGYVITVTDAGSGVPEQARPHIFDRFYRGDAARVRGESEIGGAGLGLAIARWVAKQHGGDVSLADSTGQATTFRIHLPFMSG